MATWTTDGSQADVEAKIALASAGDVVQVPSGSFTWGAGGDQVIVNKAITLEGAGISSTTIVISETSGTFGSGCISITGGGVLKSLTITGASASSKTPISASTTSGWRVTDVKYDQIGSSYFTYVGNVYGLIDNCTINSNAGTSELIFARGPTDSWQTVDSLGGGNNVFVEDCTFNGPGYVCDANSNARVVVRFCTINGNMKVDGHGLASNTPARGVRHMEVYNNYWTSTSGFWPAIEMRGGSGHVFNNTSDMSLGSAWFQLREYGSTATWPNFNNTYQTPDNYPVGDQVGCGKDIEGAAVTSVVAKQMVRINTVGTTDFTLIGSPNNNVGTQFIATGPGTGTGTVDYAPASEPMYIWGNLKNGSQWPLSWAAIPAAAETEYGGPFTMEDIIAADRNYFRETATFNGTTGMGTGTRAQMDAITPTKTGVGFWVTDEGSWNDDSPGADGRLYTWDGVAWVLEYEPYTYPHPARGGRNNPKTGGRASMMAMMF